MALVEPLIGHLLSKYPETVLEGFGKIKSHIEADPTFGSQFVADAQGLEALKASALRPEFSVPALETVVLLVNESYRNGEGNSMRSHLLRELCRGDVFNVVRRGMAATLTDKNLATTFAVMSFLQVAAKAIPLALLARFNHEVPLQASCFTPQLPYSHRRLRAARIQFFMNLVTSKYNTQSSRTICSFGFLTHLLEDSAALIQEGTEQGLQLGKEALRIFDQYFMSSRQISLAEKKSVLSAQRNIFRLIVKALGFAPVADDAAHLIYRIVVELLESPADYSAVKEDSPDDRGMPNYMIFFLLRQLKPRRSALMSQIAVFILHKAPDLIRPFFTRLSGHLAEEDRSQQAAPWTEKVAVMNVMTRIFRAPIPYHLASRQVVLTTAAKGAGGEGDMFYTMSPQDVVDEVCPAWVAEYAHSIINGKSDLLTLTLVLQMTTAVLQRATEVLACVRAILQAQEQREGELHATGDQGNRSGMPKSEAEKDAEVLQELRATENEEQVDSFLVQTLTLLQSTMPKREEFWHRMTQQIHILQEQLYRTDNSRLRAKVEFVSQRMMALMELYTTVFDLRQPWSSAVATILPRLSPGPRTITDALRSGSSDPLSTWSPVTVSALCRLLVSNLERGVSLAKIHHINMSNGQKHITEWPVLLSLLLWAAHHKSRKAEEPLVERALLWVAKLVQWVVHSVTVHFSCLFSEAYLWVITLRPETVPIFLHLLNNILMRSMSKAADRVAQEFLDGSAHYGLLVSTAETFIAKFDEKQAAARAGDKPNSSKKGAAGASASSTTTTTTMELWNEHLIHNAGAFKEVIELVKQSWQAREQYVRSALEDVADGSGDGQTRIAAQLVLTATQEHATMPLHEQLRKCLATLHSPVEGATAEESQLVERASRANGAALVSCVNEDVRRLVSQNALCWELGVRCLVGTDAAPLARAVLSTVERLSPSEAAELVAALSEERQAALAGFFFLLLSGLHTLLRVKYSETTVANNEEEGDDDDNKERDWANVSVLLRGTYMGGLGVMDRMRYASMLTLHYLTTGDDSPPAAAPRTGEEEEEGSSSDGDDEGDTGSSDEDNDTAEKDAVSDDDDVNDAAAAAAADAGAGQGRKVASRQVSGRVRVLRDAAVPSVLVQGRFLIWNHRPSTLTPEEDMLALLADMWTEDDVIQKALQCPPRLHNRLRVETSGEGEDVGMDLLQAVFPEVSEEADLVVLSFEAITASTLSDPRYLLPLVHAVNAIPHTLTQRKMLAVRCVPLLIRALSFTDPGLRALAAATLGRAHIPNGAVKVICGYAKLKMCQLTAKGRRNTSKPKAKGKEGRGAATAARGSRASATPRLPAPTSALLVLSLRVIRHYSEVLHNHIIQLLSDPKAALSNAVPFSQWLHAFPLECVSLPLMLQSQEDMTRPTAAGNGGVSNRTSVMQASVTEAADRMRRETPPQLRFALQLVAFGCQTDGDWKALDGRACVASLTLLAELLGSSEALRLEVVRTLDAVVSTSGRVAGSAAVHSHLVSWLFAFLLQLTHEYEGRSFFFGTDLFTQSLRLLQKLCEALVAQSSLSHTQRQQYLTSALILRQALTRVGATMKETLGLVHGCLATLSGTRTPTTEQGATAASETLGVKRRHEDDEAKRNGSKRFRKEVP